MIASLDVVLGANEVRARPGDRMSLAFTVENSSPVFDRVRIAVSGIPAGWYELEPDLLALPPNTSGRGRVVLAPLAGGAGAAGTYPLTITATSEQNPRLQGRAVATLIVPQIGGLHLDVTPIAASGREATYRITVRNDANAPVRVSLLPRDLEDGLLFQLTAEGPLAIPAGEQRTLALRVAPKETPTIGEAHLYEIEVRGLPEGVAATAPVDHALVGEVAFTYLPRLRSSSVPSRLRRLPLWALLLLPLLLLALVFSAGVRTASVLSGPGATKPPVPPSATALPTITPVPTPSPIPTRPPVVAPPPSILSFAVQAKPDGAVTANWATGGATTVRLNGKPVAPNGTIQLPAGSTSTLVLSASNAGGTTTRTLVVVPAAAAAPGIPLGVAPFLPEIKLFVLQADSATGKPALRWQVTGTDKVEVDGQQVPPLGRRTLVRAGPATYRLVATNRFGSVTASLVVPKGEALALQSTLMLHPPEIRLFALERTGGAFALAWETQQATAVYLDGKIVAASGRLALGTPKQGKTFTLVASNREGSSRAQLVVTSSGGGSPGPRALTLRVPRIIAFSVQRANGRLVAAWQVAGAERVIINGKAVPAASSQPVPPGARTLLLVAANQVGVSRRQIAISAPAPTVTTAPTGTAAPTPTSRPAMPTASATRTATPRPLATAAHTATPRPSATRTPAPRPSATYTLTARPATATGTASSTPTASGTPTLSPTPAHTLTGSPTRGVGPQSAPTWTSTPTVSPTGTATAARVLPWTSTPTDTSTRVPLSAMRTRTPTPSPSATRTSTPRPPSTGTFTATPTPTAEHTATSTLTRTATPTDTPTSTATSTPTRTATPTATPSATPTRTSTSTATGTPTSTPLPSWSVAPPGPVTMPAYSAATFTVTNAGPGTLTALAFGTSSPAFAVAPARSGSCTQGETLAAGGTCRIMIGFAPSRPGGTSATLTVSANGVPPSYQVALTGQLATITIAPAPPDPSCSGGGTAVCVHSTEPRTFTITNRSPSASAGGIVPSVAPAASPGIPGFSIRQDTCGSGPLAPGANCTFAVSYQAASYPNCDLAGTLTVVSDASPPLPPVPLWGWAYCIG